MTPVQISTPGAFNGSLTASTTLSGVTLGNTIIVVVMHGDRSGNSPPIVISDAQGTYASDVSAGTFGGVARSIIARLVNANAGTHTISAVATGTAAQSFGEIVALELPPALLDQSNTGGASSGTAASVAATAGLADTGELAVAGLYFDQMSLGGGTFPPTGGTGTYTEIVAHTGQSDAAYQTLTSTAGAGANWGTFTQSSRWAAVIAIYKPVITFVPIAPMALGGMVVQVCQ